MFSRNALYKSTFYLLTYLPTWFNWNATHQLELWEVEGSGLLVELVVLVLIVSILVGNASEVSGLSAVTYSLTVWSSGTTEAS